ncbi:IS1634 family transposase [Mycoplasma sp. NEAQ87857]|uniref:IS1634 family transposase n=1 Tax=Mycoplasma sp. NEAQ87857 TaxID=2683967 RepID=UPI0013186678|nr:IS1634 family transposase [Mycoplasma sp. NEAQ87857]QGZ97235.1 IS1634 family transposase [Mycoplasma sp. NEAQ87857]
MKKEKWIIVRSKRKDTYYITAAISNGHARGYKRSIGLGNLEKLEKSTKDPINLLKEACVSWDPEWPKDKILQEVNKVLKNSVVESKVVNYGHQVLFNTIDDLDIFEKTKETRSKELIKILKFIISTRILKQQSLIKTFESIPDYEIEFDSKKTTFYNSLDYLSDNKTTILKNINNSLISKNLRSVDVMWFDSSTVYFETFTSLGFKHPGYSKDGKFKEDQIVVGLITDENGIPIHYKLFKGNTADPNTFIPFINEIKKIYNVRMVTIIADRGMSTNKNIRFLEQNNIDFIISYRLKIATKRTKLFAQDPEGYVDLDNFKFKEETYESLWQKKRPNGRTRRRIITYSEKRAKKDKQDRQILIDNFNKKAKNGIVAQADLLAGKKYKFFKEIENGKTTSYKLDYEKIERDKKFDGLYAYETSRHDLTVQDVVDLYAKQWQVEENFRTLKNALRIRPVYVRSDKHIEGYFLLCFISLVLMRYLLTLVNKNLEPVLGVKNERFTNTRLIKAILSANKYVEVINSKIITEKLIENKDNMQYLNDFAIIKKILETQKP